jgi:hypothetical protein
MCPPPAATHARHLQGIEELDVEFGLAVCSSILPVMLLPATDVFEAADDPVLLPYLAGPTNAQLDSDRMKTPAMEAC